MPQLKKQQQQKQHNTNSPKMKRINNNEDKATESVENNKYSNTKFYVDSQDFTLEREQNLSETFNYESRVVVDGCCSNFGVAGEFTRKPNKINGSLTSDKFNEARDLRYGNDDGNEVDEHVYENLTYEKELLLHKFFRSRDAIYENLCRGCGYGVFEAHGDLCFFCASIVNGVRQTPGGDSNSVSNSDLDLINNSNNIYENICEKCYTIYSTDACEVCDVKVGDATKKKSVEPTNSVKISKSKSFNKRNEKRGLFQGFIGSLKRAPKSPKHQNTSGSSTSVPKLEIIHNVDGYEHVFRTQETFDLQRICELKQAQQKSCSDQHIYGRLKFTPEAQSNSTQTLPLPKVETQIPKQKLNKADSEGNFLNNNDNSSGDNNCKNNNNNSNNNSPNSPTSISTASTTSGKRPRISKPRFLSAITSATTQKKKNSFRGKARAEEKSTAAAADATVVPKQSPSAHIKQRQSLYLADSVCNWMTSLRREVHNYHILGEELCNPKSIPAKHNFIGYYIDGAATNEWSSSSMTNSKYIDDVTFDIIGNSNSDVSIDSERERRNSDTEFAVTLRSKHYGEQVFQFDQHHTPVACAQMVNRFIRNLMLNQELREMSNEEQLKERKSEMDTKLERRELSIQKRQAQRAKRQGIYLKNHEINDAEESKANNICKIRVENTNEDQNTSNSTNNNGEIVKIVGEQQQQQRQPQNVNCANKQKTQNENNFQAELDSTALSSSESTVSRRRTAQVIGGGGNDLQKRCGVYDLKLEVEKESVVECIGDILSEFDTYLQHEEEAPIAVAAAAVEAEEQAENDAAEQSTAYRKTEKGSTLDPFSEKVNEVDEPLVSSLSLLVTPPPTVAQSQENFINFVELLQELHLTRSLHKIVLSYEQPLYAFLKAIHTRYPKIYAKWPKNRLDKKFKRFHKYCFKKSIKINKTNKLSDSPSVKKCNNNNNSVIQKDLKEFENVSTTTTTMMMATTQSDHDDDVALNGERNSVKIIVQQFQIQSANEMVTTKTKTQTPTTESEKKINNVTPKNNNNNNVPPKSMQIKPLKPHRAAPKKPEPPQVPQRNPKTALSTTITTTKSNKTESHIVDDETTTATTKEESIYHPIWNFKTVGEVPERYQTDADYYEIDDDGNVRDNIVLKQQQQLHNLNAADTDSLASVLITANDHDTEEDHGEWETDDEFMFTTTEITTATTTKRTKTPSSLNSSSNDAISSSTTPSIKSSKSSLSGSTVAGFSSSTATLASAISSSLTHQILRNVGIFYSLTEPKLRAIIYDYDRVHASKYFAKQQQQQNHVDESVQQQQLQQLQADSPCSSHDSNESNANDSGIGKSPKAQQRSPMPPPRTTSAAKSDGVPHIPPPKLNSESGCHVAAAVTTTTTTSTKPSTKKSPQLLPDSVLAWKFMLLDVNYIEDEEDMIVSEAEILRAQEIKEDIDTRQTQQLNILQRFKSASFGNLVDLPNEDEKIGIGSAIDRMRNKLQRGVFKINVRSPKSDKKNRGIFRRAEATSLYLEDGMKPKYPIFGAPLEQLELDKITYPNVPRFVVDCVAYIEQKDCILQEGLYRASGNKVSVEELKQKLSESYIYDPKLLNTDDIHTLTSLLKLFFRELGSPLIPQDIYERLGRNFSDAAGIETIREAFEDIREPNRSTLKFIIKHLTNVAACSSENRMPASNLAIVWGPCILSANQIEFDIGRMNTLAKVLIENYSHIFNESERLVS